MIFQNLTKVDLYRYSEDWEISFHDALKILYRFNFPEKHTKDSAPSACNEKNIISTINKKSSETPISINDNVLLIDLRPEPDFACHLPDAVNVPLSSLSQTSRSPFADANVLERQWLELENVFQPGGTPAAALPMRLLHDRRVVVVCFDGETSRVATSVLRAKGVEAFSIRHGIRACADDRKS